jgi:hypothetical protein
MENRFGSVTSLGKRANWRRRSGSLADNGCRAVQFGGGGRVSTMPAKTTATKADTARWTCPSCRKAVRTAFCSRCGEQPLSPKHLTLGHLARQTATAVLSFDGKVARSLRALITRPGALTVAFVEGWRKPYLGPFQLFLTANAGFFALQSLSKIQIFSSTLHSHLNNQDWAPFAQTLVARHLAARHVAYAAYAPVFDKAAILYGKTFIILIVLAFSAILPLVFRRERRPFAAHVVFGLHFYAFFLLLLCVALGLSSLDLALGGGGLETGSVDLALSLFNVGATMAYLYFAVGTVYGDRGWRRISKTLILTIVAAALMLGYRFVILLITLAAT